MKNKTLILCTRVIALGAVAGMRAMLAPVATTRYLSKQKPAKGLAKALSSDIAQNIVATLAVGELIGDKLPFTPNRTEAGGVSARILTGAIAGGVLFKSKNKDIALGAAIGGVSALAATFLFFNARRALGKNTVIPDVVTAIVEDIAAVSIAAAAIH